MNDKTAKIIKKQELYPDGANSPTFRTEYLCPCGKGKVVYEHVAGFSDRYCYIECKKCEKKYEVVTGCGHLWELVEK